MRATFIFSLSSPKLKNISSYILSFVTLLILILPLTTALAAPLNTGPSQTDVTGGKQLVPFVPDECYGKPTKSANGVQVNCGWEQLMQLGKNVIDNAIILAAMAAVVSIAYAGWLLLSSGGDSGAKEDAKKIMWKVVTGIALTMAAWLLVHTVLSWLGVDNSFSLLEG